MYKTPVRLVGGLAPRRVRPALSPFVEDTGGLRRELRDLRLFVEHTFKELDRRQREESALRQGPPGARGVPGESVDVQEVVREVLAVLKQQKHVSRAPQVPVVEKNTQIIIERAPSVETVVEAVFEQLSAGKKKITLAQVEGIENKFAELRNAAALGTPKIYGDTTWARGGGDTVKAGTNITIATNPDGNKVISAASGGTSTTIEKVVPVQAGSDVTLNLATLTHPFVDVLGVNKNGQLLDPSDPQFGWSRVGNTVTVLNGFDTDSYQVTYTYA